ncbi:MAG: DUF2213 domain-containing protein [Candidatus Paceibacterota bacterium]|jgi:hypothetical protein
METYLSIQDNQKITGYTVTEKMHQKKKHLIVPVTMIVEGVLAGSAGPLLHLAEEFGKFPESWNGIPVVINHPEVDGINVSANSPDLIETATVGRVYNAKMVKSKLKAEVWLEESKLGEVSPDVLSAIGLKQTIEVSVGVFTDSEETPGIYNGKQYTAIARNHRPDHLALLPGGIGACSIADGCGIRVNQLKKEGGSIIDVNEATQFLESQGFQVKKIPEVVEVSKIVENSEQETPPKEVELVRTNFKNNVIMSDETKCAPCIEKKATELIANKATKFTEADRGWLETFEEVQLNKMEPVIEAPEVNKLSAEDQAALDFGKKMLAKKKADMTANILANTAEGVWPVEVLANMDEAMLERVEKSIKVKEVPADYSGNAGGSMQANVNSGQIAPLIPNTVN